MINTEVTNHKHHQSSTSTSTSTHTHRPLAEIIPTHLTHTADYALIVGATMRLTRLITTDDLGKWLILEPLHKRLLTPPAPASAHAHARLLAEVHLADTDQAVTGHLDAATPPTSKPWHKYLAGLECPHCVGMWVGVAVAASYLAARRRPRALAAWRFAASTLALNTAMVSLGRELDYWS